VVRGFYLRFGEGVSEEANRRALALAEALLRAPPPGLLDAVPAYGVLYLEYDPRRLSRGRLLRLLKGLPQERAEEGRVVEIPVRYDGEDLPEVASRLGLSLEAVKALHQKPLYRVYALGFTPGFPFLAEVEPALRLPRKPHPRPRVPAHAVAVAGVQTGIYPLPSPGGWNLLGTSLVAVYDPHRETPFLLRPGDRVRFLEAEGPTPPEPRPLELLPEEPRLPALLVEEPGLMDLVVDGGRFLGGHLGLARSGPLDAPSARLANRLVGNGAGAPLLEFAYKGPVLTALRDLVAAFAGYGFVALLEGEEIPPGQSFLWPRGKTLRFRPRGPGVRGYLAVAGGLEVRPFLGSASPDLRGRIGRPLWAGDVLGLEALRPVRPRYPEGAGGPWRGGAFRAHPPRRGPGAPLGEAPGAPRRQGEPRGVRQARPGGPPGPLAPGAGPAWCGDTLHEWVKS